MYQSIPHTDKAATVRHFRFLPAFASWLLHGRLDEFVAGLVNWHRTKAPQQAVLQQREQVIIRLTGRLLYLMAHNKPGDVIQSLWKPTALQEAPESIISLMHGGYETALHLLPQYTSDQALSLAIVREGIEFCSAFSQAALQQAWHFAATKQAATQAALQQSETFLKNAQHIASFGCYYFDATRQNIEGTPELYRILGEGNGIDPSGLFARIHTDDQALVNESLKMAIKTNDIFNITFRYQGRNGQQWLWCQGAVSANQAGEVQSITGILADVSTQARLMAQLKESEKRYKEAEIIAHIGHFTYDIEAQKHTWTDELFRIFGWEPNSGKNSVKNVNNAVLPEDLPALKQAISKGVSKRQNFTITFRIRNERGGIRHLQARAQIMSQPPGKAATIFGIVQDVSENAALLQRLRQSRQLYKQAQAIVKIGNWRYDVLTGKTYWSAEASRLFGITPNENNEADLDAMRNLTPTRFLLRIDGYIARCLKTGQKFSFESEALLRDGTRKVFYNKGIADRDEHGKITGVIGTIQDITEQKAIENELRNNQRFSEKISHAAPAIVWLANKEQNTFTFISKMAERILGYAADELSAMRPSGVEALVHPDDFPLLDEKMEQAFSLQHPGHSNYDENNILETCYRLRHKDGGWVWLQNYTTIFERDPETHRIIQMLHVSVDVTSRMKAEEDLRQKNMLLQQSNASLQEFAYIASHDLQEPLRKIATFGNMLENLGPNPPVDKANFFISKIVSSATRMQNMINDLLTVSLISGNSTFKKESLQQILDDALLTQELKIEKTGTRIVVPEPLPEATVVASQMQQLFQNLISNAMKFARPDVPPVITISWAPIAAGAGPEADKPYIRLNIEDNGIGFDNSYAHRIFAMFQRLHGKSEYEGTGIGLAICRKIAEHHGGTISATGEKEKGAVFTVILPWI